MNYLLLKNTPKVDYSFNLSDDMVSRIDRFQTYHEQSRVEKVVYLARLFQAVNPSPQQIEITRDLLAPKVRTKRTSNLLPGDIVDLIRKVATQYEISYIAALDLILIYGFRYTKDYSLDVVLTKTKP